MNKKKIIKFFTITEDSIWMEFCQRIADYYFYKSLYKKYTEKQRDVYLEKYYLWIDRKFGK